MSKPRIHIGGGAPDWKSAAWTLCRFLMNAVETTDSPKKVTCKSCLRKMKKIKS